MESIVEELKRDRESGARRLAEEYRAGLLTLARRLCADEGDAEELVNRTFAAVVEGIDDYVEQSAFFAWMSQILANLHSTDVRRKSNRMERTDPTAVDAAADEDSAARLFRDVDASLLRDAVSELPDAMREAIVLRYFLDMPVGKIARFLAIPSGTVMSRLHYARLALAAKLGTQRPGARMLLLAMLLAAGLAIGGALYTLGTAVFGSRAENAEPVSHAENAESAEPVSHAENAEPTLSTLSTVSTLSTDSTPESSEMNAKSLLAATASLALAAAPSPAASSYPLDGGTRSFAGDDVVNTFTESGTLVVYEAMTVRALFVAGGGGGGCGVGGGGGGGGVVEIAQLWLQPGTYTITVGAGGTGAPSVSDAASNGGDSTMTDSSGTAVSPLLPALGGGAGGGWIPAESHGSAGSAGGSGGGSCGGYASGAGTSGQGYAGGQSGERSSSGGGGAGGAGGDGGTEAAGVQKAASAVGGAGYTSDITGLFVAYGGGGGGGGGDGGACPASAGTDGGGDGTAYNSDQPAGDGEDGLGGGGGGSGWRDAGSAAGGSGGSGVVILRHTPSSVSYPLAGGTRTFVGSDVVNTFTESGALTVYDETTVRALFVAGGGGGGAGVGGGGGGGGVVALDELTLAPGSYVVTIGAGGAGGTLNKAGSNGGDTTLEDSNGVAVTNALPAIGGGRGGAWNYQNGHLSGGSGGASCGGKAGAAGTPGQGYAGGLSYARSSGGGGGAGGPGGDGGNNTPRSPSAVGGIGVTSDISGVAIAYGGGGGGGGGDNGVTPASPGTDGGGDGTGYNSGLPGGDGEDGGGGGGGGSGWQNNTKDGGRGGSGVVILRYTFDASRLATPTITAKSVSPGVKSASVALDVVSFGRDASSVSIVATARPSGGGESLTQTFPNVPTGTSTLTILGLTADVSYDLWLVATNDRNLSTASIYAGSVVPVGDRVKATGGEEFQWNLRRRIHVFTNATDVLVVEKSGFADVLLVGGGGAGGTGVGGGGGGGGVVYRIGVPLAAGTYAVSVGRGGNSNVKDGGDTTFAGLVAFGGGGGGGWGPTAGNPGGCGGGSCGGFAGAAGTPGQGYDGGQSYSRSSSGGGGAGGPGGDGGNNTPRSPSAVGGIGFACSITGVEIRYGGGGGGGGGDNGATPGSPGTDGGGDGTAFNSVLPGGDGADGLGAGGGGSGFGTAGTARGGYGGCGTVIVAYDLPPAGTMILVK